MSPQNGRRSSLGAARASDSQSGRLRLTESGIFRLRLQQPPREPSPRELRNDPAIRNYVLVCLAAMVVLLVVLLVQDMGSGSLIPVLIGIMGVITRWRAAPILVILSHSGLYYIEMVRYYLIVPMPVFVPPDLGDLVTAAVLVVYVAAHYRMQGLFHEIVPPETLRSPRRQQGVQGKPPPELPARRSTAVVSPTELRGVLLLAGWALAALIFWTLLPHQVPTLGSQGTVRAPVWRGFLLVWALGAGLLVLGSLLRYVGYRHLSVAEARLWLQDVLWRETHREQRRINRWLAWARLRRRKREGAV